MIKNIIFDWSGVISDDFINVYKATALVFRDIGIRPISITEFNQEFKLPYMDFWSKYLPHLTIDEEKRLFFRAWRQLKRPKPFNGANNVLHELKKRKINIITLSSHNTKELKAEARHYGIYGLFKEINGSIPNKIDVVNDILKRNGFNPKETAFVGDMTHDIDAGRSAGVITIAIVWADARFLYEPLVKIKRAKPDHIIFNLNQLLRLLS